MLTSGYRSSQEKRRVTAIRSNGYQTKRTHCAGVEGPGGLRGRHRPAPGGAFYEQTLDLPVLEQDDFACVLDAHGTTLRVTAVPEVIRAGYGAGDIIHGVSVQSPLEPLRPSTPKTS